VDEDDDAWRALIDAQHGVVTNQQAEEHGVTAAMIDHRVRNGVYQRLGEHTVATFAATPSREALEVAASLANPSGVLSHFSAARRHDLKAPDDGRVHISVPVKAPTGKGPRPGATRTLTVHRVRHLTDKDISERGGLRVTSLERTLIDLFGTLKRRDDRRALVAEAFSEAANNARADAGSDPPDAASSQTRRALLHSRSRSGWQPLSWRDAAL